MPSDTFPHRPYRHNPRKSLALNHKFQNKTFPDAGILALDVLYQGLGDMDLVSNVMLGNSPTPQKGAPAGKAAGSSFAALLFGEGNGADAAPHAGSTKGNRKAPVAGKQVPDVAQLAALNIPVFVQQITDLAKTPADISESVPGAKQGAPANEGAQASDLTGTNAQIGQLLDSVGNKEVADIAGERKSDAKELAGKFPVSESKAASPALDPKVIAKSDKTPSTDKAQVTANATPQKMPETKTEKPADTAKDGNATQMEDPTVPTSAASKTVHAVASLAGSAVKIALNQTLPVQSKAASSIAKATVPSARVFASSQTTADAHAVKNAAPAHESQPEHDQPKKQEDAVSAVTTKVDQSSTHDQVNAVSRVLSSGSSAENPRQAATATSANVTMQLKHDVPTAEATVAPGSTVGVHSAKLLENLGQSELRVGMKMGDLGNVEIRTQLRHDQLHAEISVERGDIGHALAAELPGLQQKLHEHDVQLSSFTVNHQAAAGSGSFERGAQQQQQQTTHMAHAFGIDPVISGSSPDEIRSTDSALDVRI
ncbi:MAG TPA: flagellar hook-length control protein FliK [Terriglobales bacterium]|nr:flagellar hook-length control protein FliK [Terriglobales bacterium]